MNLALTTLGGVMAGLGFGYVLHVMWETVPLLAAFLFGCAGLALIVQGKY